MDKKVEIRYCYCATTIELRSLVYICRSKVNIVRCIHPTYDLLASIAATCHLRNLLLAIKLQTNQI